MKRVINPKEVIVKQKVFRIAMLSMVLSFGSCSEGDRERNAEVHQSVDLMGKPKLNIRTIGILLYDGYATLDAMGPHHVLSELMGTKVFFIAKSRGAITSSGGVKVEVSRSLADVDSLDILIIPGGLDQTYRAAGDTVLLNWIRRIDKTTTFTASVCTGAWILEQTGLLKGRTATTHWYGKKILQERGVIVKDERWVRDGKYWTSAGVTAGMDMSFALVNEIRGEDYTRAAMLDLEYNPQPPFAGGSEKNTNEHIVTMMRQMYDQGFEAARKPAANRSLMKFMNDPVCGMEISEDATDTTFFKGAHYAFCSKICKDVFVKNPGMFLSEK